MGCYHFHVDQIKRSEGRRVIEAAAYRAGEKLWDDYYGMEHDYTKKEGVVLAEIYLPAYAPERLRDRQTLWNEVESVEKNVNAQLAHSFNMTLMNEFSMEENLTIVRQFINEQFVARGMIADVAVHNPKVKPGEIPNPHIHVLVPIRPIAPDGSWGNKQKKIPIMDENGNPVLNKNGTPKMRAVHTTDWSQTETLLALRKAWADINNAMYQQKGLAERIDSRSYQDRGIPLTPTLHEGPQIRAMEEKGIRTEIGTLNRNIRALNARIIQLFHLRKWIKEKIQRISEAIHRLPEPTIGTYLQEYYDRRNEKAETFAYGTQKAKMHNLQEFANVISFLSTERIDTEKELTDAINAVNEEITEVRLYLNDRQKHLSELQVLIRDAEAFPGLKKIKQEYDSKVFNKKKFYQEHEKEIRRFYVVEKRLASHRNADGRIPIRRWKKELIEVSADTEITQQELQKLQKRLSMLLKVQHCIDVVLEDQITESTDGRVPENIEDLVEENTEKKSIHSQLKAKKEIIRTADKEKGASKPINKENPNRGDTR